MPLRMSPHIMSLPCIPCYLFFMIGLLLSSVATANVFVGYQIHSWNDMREWGAALNKGAHYFKVDFYFKDAAFCVSQNVKDPKGCFVMSHDPPVTATVYSSPNDVLAYISLPSRANFFQNPHKRVYVSICFKSAPPDVCGSSQNATSWLSLVDDFFHSANRVVDKHKLNVEFVLDGDATPAKERTCLNNRWRPWVTTWINDPFEAMLSNDPSKGYDRFQIFDESTAPGLLPAAAELNFGKFANGSYPLLLWEPDSEDEIVYNADIYIKWTQRYKHPKVPEFRFAINSDPVMLELYASTSSKRGAWHELFTRNGSSPFTTTFRDPTSSSLIHVAVYTGTDGVLQYSVSKIVGGFADPQQAPLKTDISSGPISNFSSRALQSILSFSTNGTQYILLVTPSGKFSLFEVDVLTWRLNFIRWDDLGISDRGRVMDTKFTVRANETSQRAFLAALVQPASNFCSLVLEVRAFSLDDPTTMLYQSCVLRGGFEAAAASVALLSKEDGRPVCMFEGLIAYSLHDNTDFLHVAYLCVASQTANITLASAIVDVGSKMHLTMQTLSGQAMVMAIAEDSFCYNTEERNKRPLPKVCDSPPTQSTENILAYSYGALDAWKKHILSNGNFITSCNEEILHGAFDQVRNSIGLHLEDKLTDKLPP